MVAFPCESDAMFPLVSGQGTTVGPLAGTKGSHNQMVRKTLEGDAISTFSTDVAIFTLDACFSDVSRHLKDGKVMIYPIV